MLDEIREIPSAHMKKHTEVAFNSYPSFKDFSQEGKERFTDRMNNIRKNDPNVLFLGLYRSDQLIAQMRLITFEMNLFGTICQVAGLGSLAVDLCHKKVGIGHKMLQYFEHHFRQKNIPLAMLLPFSPSFYHKEEYGYGTKMNVYHLNTCDLPVYHQVVNYQFLEIRDLPEIQHFYNTLLKENHGMIQRLSYEWHDLFNTTGNILVASYDSEKKIDGYLCFRFENTKSDNYTKNQMNVNDLYYNSPSALRKLLNFLRNQNDQAQTVRIRTFEPDFHYLLKNAINTSDNYVDFGYLECNRQYIGNMYKILDLQHFLEMTKSRSYNNQTISVRFCVSDASKGTKEDIVFCIEKGRGFIDKNLNDPDLMVSISLADLSSALMGVATFSSLYRIGQLKTTSPDKLKKLDLAFFIDDPLVCWSDY